MCVCVCVCVGKRERERDGMTGVDQKREKQRWKEGKSEPLTGQGAEGKVKSFHPFLFSINRCPV